MEQAAYQVTFHGREYFITARMMVAIEDYIKKGKPVGDFLTAVIDHDLFRAMNCADDVNFDNLAAFCAYFHNYAPSGCHGSPEKRKAWIKQHADARRAAEGGETTSEG